MVNGKNPILFSTSLSPSGTKATILKVLKQRGKSKSLIRDRGRKAKLPGKRISKTGNIYWETRQNRSDAPNKNI